MKINDIVFVYQLKDKEDLLWHSRIHHHEQHQAELTYFMSGSGTFHILGKKYRIFDNAIFANTEGNSHYVIADDLNKPLSYYAVLFSLDENESEIMEICKTMEVQGPKKMKNNKRFFFEEMRSKNNSNSQWLNLSSIHQLLELVYKLPEYSFLDEYPNSSFHIDNALRFFQSHVAENITLGEVASKLNLSESYLIRMFQSNMHISPMKYYTKLRIEATIGFLVSTNYSVKQIASKLNYSSEFHLSKQFKQYTGLSPLKYRKQKSKKG